MSSTVARFRTAREKTGPRWLVTGDETNDEPQRIWLSLDLLKDASANRLYLGLLSRLPQNDPSGLTTAPADALALMGRDRRVVRGFNETAQSYAARLTKWLDDRKQQGSAFALMKKLAEYCGPLPSFKIVDARGNWFARAADGTESYWLNRANWEWDDHPTAGGKPRWGRFWPIIHPNGLWTEGADWGDATGPDWGEGSGSLGSTASAEQVATIRAIVKEWKPAHAKCVNIIVAFDPASFVPTAAVNAPGMPNGEWEFWSRNVGGVQVPARLETARFLDGVT